MRRQSGQSFLEYLLLLGLVAAVMFAMSTMVRRGLQGVVKFTADQIGNQQDAEQNPNVRSGYLIESTAVTRSRTDKRTTEYFGAMSYMYDDQVQSYTNSLTNLGFTERVN